TSRTSSACRSGCWRNSLPSCSTAREIRLWEAVSDLTLRSISRFEIRPPPAIEAAPRFATLGARCGRESPGDRYCGRVVGISPDRGDRQTQPEYLPRGPFRSPQTMGLFTNLTGFGGRDMAV